MHHLSYPSGKMLKQLSSVYRSSTDGYTVRNGLLQHSAVAGDTTRVVVPDDGDLRLRIMYEYHDALIGGHRGREKTYLTVGRDLYWPRQYPFVRKYVRDCEVYQRVKSIPYIEPRCSLCSFWPSAGILFQWTLSLDSPQVLTSILVFLCSLTGSARWYIWLLYPNQSTHRLVPMSLSTRTFTFMCCLVNSCPIGIRGSQLSSGVPCSKHSERA